MGDADADAPLYIPSLGQDVTIDEAISLVLDGRVPEAAIAMILGEGGIPGFGAPLRGSGEGPLQRAGQ